MNTKEIKLSLDKIYDKSTDLHNIYTPLNLCEDMINSLSNLNGNILVISNLEFLIILKSKISLHNVYYTTSCDIKKQVAISLGIDLNKIYNLEYNNKDINLGAQDMKFDVIVQNPPYNPNSLWKKFVEKCIELLDENGQMVVIHPDSWRISSKHNKLCQHLKEHISELHIKQYEIWRDEKVAISTDWYLYNKKIQNNCIIHYLTGEIETINLKEERKILNISKNSLPYSILNKICTKDNNGIIVINTGFASSVNVENGKYKQCGGIGNGTGWINNNYVLTNEPTTHQYDNKIVMSYAGKPRAKYFNGNEGIGVGKALYWLTDNKSLPILLNSKMFWKLCCHINDPQPPYWKPYGTMAGIPGWILKSLNFDNLNIQTEDELYKHYNLTEEEINWIERN